MPLKTVRDILVGNAAVTALVGQRVSPIESEQGEAFPCVTLLVNSVDPANTLRGWANLDQCHVQVSAWAYTYAAALEVANVCRTALQNAGHVCELRESDQFAWDKEPGAFRIPLQVMIWI